MQAASTVKSAPLGGRWYRFIRACVRTAGFGTELVAGVNLIRLMSSGNGRILWRFMQLVFGLCLTVATFSRSVFGLPFMVLGLWKGGFPETTGCLMAAYHEGRIGVESTRSLLDGLGTMLHHSATAMIICSLATHLFPLSRQMIAVCILPVVQHGFVLVRVA